MKETPFAAMVEVNAPTVVPLGQFKAVMTPTAGETVNEYKQFFPPIFKKKSAVPNVVGVPVIKYVKLPEPLEKFPDPKVAVNPETPVEFTV